MEKAQAEGASPLACAFLVLSRQPLPDKTHKLHPSYVVIAVLGWIRRYSGGPKLVGPHNKNT